jgi:deoxyribose-phosphate aldolase
MIRDIERKALMAGGAGGDVELTAEDLQRIADRVRALIAPGPAPSPDVPAIGPEALAKMIDHTLLKPEATSADIEKLCGEATRYGFYSVCVNPTYVTQCKALLRGSPVKLCCVVGFPLGAQSPQIKALEARKAIREGAAEIDMVINIGALKSGDTALVLRDIRAVVEACKDGRALSKVIFETALLTDEEKVTACELSMKAGADYVKTSTGFASGGATAEDIALMARTVAPKKLGVKASGGVRTYDDAIRMIRAGATRIGASSSVKIVDEARARAAQKG